ncbi:MvaI/BcnI restriction endonuclease family protein (plasmid) [Bacillus sp. H8-1]|nr:MvaI/BcnI restriction endonuclease family protein [Bacillus sp. H8-1]
MELLEIIPCNITESNINRYLVSGGHITDKERIIALFKESVKGRHPNTSGRNINHDGKEGHWLEKQFGVRHNADNKPDLYGYELKNQTTSKITFGDWLANRYIFKEPSYLHLFNGDTATERRDSFIKIFGKPNLQKGGRYSWSGEPCPKIMRFNKFGQILEITPEKDIVVIYDFSQDQRKDKSTIIPIELQNSRVELARWFGERLPSSEDKGTPLKFKLESKFNDKGWFTCKKDISGAYKEICFGDPINFDTWIELVEQGIVFFDSGMYEGNSRFYSIWRTDNPFWDSLIVERYQ